MLEFEGALKFVGARTWSSTAISFGSCISLLRKAAEFSRLARGRMISLSMFESAKGTGTSSSLLPCSPKLGLARQKAMRTSMLRNSYSTSSASFLACDTHGRY